MEKIMISANTMEARVSAINSILEENGAEFTAEFVKVWKNNHEVDGYCLRSAAHNCSPTIYSGEWLNADDESVAAYLMDVYKDSSTDFDLNAVLSWDYILENVKPKLVSVLNADGLKSRDIVTIPFLDMLISFYIPISGLPGNAMGSIQVTEMLLKNADISVEELHSMALRNLEKDVTIQSLSEALASLMGGEHEASVIDFPMIVVGNKSMLHGAAAILSKNVLERLIAILGDKVAILPSSIHECIAIGYRTEEDLQNYIDMVRSINATMLDIEDKLTDNVYVYTDGELEAIG
ncbi:MAG: DUF5688 family protein [Firmicutes bacterium]|nr:DUF5688 family protein [Bacillota bacterium]